MSQLPIPRIPNFRQGSLPDAKSLVDRLIMQVSIDGTQRTLLESDGQNWNPVGQLPTVSSEADAIAGLDNSTVITPLRLAEVLAALGLISAGGENGYVTAGYVTPGYVSP